MESEEGTRLNKLSEAIIGAAIAVHKELGAGLLESAYQACLAFELRDRGYQIEIQKELPVIYRGIRVECGYRLDLIVEGVVVVELKSVEKLDKFHDAQMLSYLNLSGMKLGLLINFNVLQLVKGIRRLVNNFPS